MTTGIFDRKNWRLGLIFSTVFLLFSLLVFRLFQIQVLDQKKYTALAESQHGISYSLPAARGKIYSQGGFPLVSNKLTYLLYAEPPKIEKKAEVAEKILGFLDLSSGCPVVNFSPDADWDQFQLKKACLREAERRLSFDRQWIPLIRGISQEEKERIEELGLSGIGFEKDPKRFYPEEKLCSHILGFVGSDELGEPKGYYGLEGFYDGDLAGITGKILEERSALGEPILVGKYKKRPPKDGRNLILTLDRAVQFVVEEKLLFGVKQYGAESGTVIVMEPQTGKILAMANWPSYDPAEPMESVESTESVGSAEPVESVEEVKTERQDLAIASSYEPGSAMKPLTIAAGIATGKITPQTTFISKPLVVGNYTIRTWDNKYYGEENMIEVLERSDNTGAAWVALEKLGKRTLYDYFSKFGLGQKSGIDLEGEAEGIVKPLVEWGSIDLANAAFGQGISVTPLQLATAFSVFANGGELVRPYLVSEIRDGDRVVSFEPERKRRVISEENAEILVEMLERAAEHGEAKFFITGDYKVAGKTGTGQIPVAGKYDPHKTNATFVGFLSRSRKFVMLVKLEKPSASVYAAETAVPLWMEIAKGLIAYWGVPPDK